MPSIETQRKKKKKRQYLNIFIAVFFLDLPKTIPMMHCTLRSHTLCSSTDNPIPLSSCILTIYFSRNVQCFQCLTDSSSVKMQSCVKDYPHHLIKRERKRCDYTDNQSVGLRPDKFQTELKKTISLKNTDVIQNFWYLHTVSYSSLTRTCIYVVRQTLQ